MVDLAISTSGEERLVWWWLRPGYRAVRDWAFHSTSFFGSLVALVSFKRAEHHMIFANSCKLRSIVWVPSKMQNFLINLHVWDWVLSTFLSKGENMHRDLLTHIAGSKVGVTRREADSTHLSWAFWHSQDADILSVQTVPDKYLWLLSVLTSSHFGSFCVHAERGHVIGMYFFGLALFGSILSGSTAKVFLLFVSEVIYNSECSSWVHCFPLVV